MLAFPGGFPCFPRSQILVSKPRGLFKLLAVSAEEGQGFCVLIELSDLFAVQLGSDVLFAYSRRAIEVLGYPLPDDAVVARISRLDLRRAELATLGVSDSLSLPLLLP